MWQSWSTTTVCPEEQKFYLTFSANCEFPKIHTTAPKTVKIKMRITKRNKKKTHMIFIRSKCSKTPSLWFPSYQFWAVAWQFYAISPHDRGYFRCPYVATSYRWVAAMHGQLFRARKSEEKAIKKKWLSCGKQHHHHHLYK